MSTLSPSNPSPPPRKKSPWLIAGVFVLICLVGYLLFHCCRPCPPDLTPSALGFSTARTSGIDGLNHGDLNLPINEKIPVTIGLFGQDDSTLVKPDSAIGFKLVLLDASYRPHPRLQLIQSTSGVLQAGNPTASLEIELRWIDSGRKNNSSAPNDKPNKSDIFRKAKFYTDELKPLMHLTAGGETAIICARTFDTEIQEICHNIGLGYSEPNTSTVHITVLGVITQCEGGNCVTSSVMPQDWNFECLSNPGEIAPINPYSSNDILTHLPPGSLGPGSLKMEFESNLTSVGDAYSFQFSVGASSTYGPQTFSISDDDHASRMIVSDNQIVHVINLCNP